MYAVIATGGKQYKVSQDDVLSIEKIEGETGTSLTFDQVIALGEEGGELKITGLNGAKVEAEIVSQYKADKVVAFKMKRRKGYRRTHGHRQNLTSIKITAINAG